MNHFWRGFEKYAMTAKQKHYAKWVGAQGAAGATGGALLSHLSNTSKVKGALIGGALGGLIGIPSAYNHRHEIKGTK
jgi:hypothetical protein